jgi:hypothetical protein
MNVLYPKFKEAILKGLIDLSAVSVKWMLIDETVDGYDAANEFLGDITVGARGPSTGALATKTFTGGVFDADDAVWTAPAAGTTYEAILLYVDTGNAATSRLIQYINDAAPGLPITTNGADINRVHDNGANKIFAL